MCKPLDEKKLGAIITPMNKSALRGTTMSGRFWSTTEVATLLGFTRQGIHKRFKQGKIRGAELLNGSRSSVVIPAETVEEMRQERIAELTEHLNRLKAAEVV